MKVTILCYVDLLKCCNRSSLLIFKFPRWYKLSNRITKVQTDNQIRFQDLETGKLNQTNLGEGIEKKLPGSSEPQDLGGVSEYDVAATEQVQKTQSIESVGTVVAGSGLAVHVPDACP